MLTGTQLHWSYKSKLDWMVVEVVVIYYNNNFQSRQQRIVATFLSHLPISSLRDLTLRLCLHMDSAHITTRNSWCAWVSTQTLCIKRHWRDIWIKSTWKKVNTIMIRIKLSKMFLNSGDNKNIWIKGENKYKKTIRNSCLSKPNKR